MERGSGPIWSIRQAQRERERDGISAALRPVSLSLSFRARVALNSEQDIFVREVESGFRPSPDTDRGNVEKRRRRQVRHYRPEQLQGVVRRDILLWFYRYAFAQPASPILVG